MRHCFTLCTAGALAVLALSCSAAQAAVVNVQFGLGQDIKNTNYGGISPAYVGTGPAADTGTTWNMVAGGDSGVNWGTSFVASSLKTSTGVSTGVSINNNSYYQAHYFIKPGFGVGTNGINDDSYDNLTRSFMGNLTSLTISGLEANTPYDLYVVMAGNHDVYENPGRNGTATVGDVTLSTTGSPDARTSLLEGRDYVLFHPASTETGQITLELSPNSQYSMINAIQIVTVPEPATLGMLVGGVALLLNRRRRSVR